MQSDEIRRALGILQGLGHSPVAAAGILGNLTTESGNRLNTRAVHDNGTGIGIAGWRDPSPGAGRKTNLMNFARGQGADIYDLGTQLKFLDHELRTSEKGVLGGLQKARTPEEAATAFIGFERPQGWTAANPKGGIAYTKRANNARSIAGMQPLSDGELGVGGGGASAKPRSLGDAFGQKPQAGTSLADALPGATLPGGSFVVPVAVPDPAAQAYGQIAQQFTQRQQADATAESARRAALFGGGLGRLYG